MENNDSEIIDIEIDYRGFPTGIVCVVIYQCSRRMSHTCWSSPSCEIFSRIFVGTSLKEVHERAFLYAQGLAKSYQKVELCMTHQGEGAVTFEVVKSTPPLAELDAG